MQRKRNVGYVGCWLVKATQGLTCAVQLLHAQKDNEGKVVPVSAKDRSCRCAKHALVQRHVKDFYSYHVSSTKNNPSTN